MYLWHLWWCKLRRVIYLQKHTGKKSVRKETNHSKECAHKIKTRRIQKTCQSFCVKKKLNSHLLRDRLCWIEYLRLKKNGTCHQFKSYQIKIPSFPVLFTNFFFLAWVLVSSYYLLNLFFLIFNPEIWYLCRFLYCQKFSRNQMQ